MLPGKEIFLLFIGSFLLHLAKATNTKHMYALCPPDFFGIGTECYYMSQKKQNWLDAHFDCKDRKSRLAEPNRYEDRVIRKFLVNNDLSKESKWIGGNYNWAQKKWQWQDGKEFVYQSFSQTPGGVQELQYHCAILNPKLKYRWSASSCVEKHQYICQHRMPYVNEKHRSRIFTRWNQTYPNEQATEVEVILNDPDTPRRGNRQSIPVNGRSTNAQRLNRHRNYLASEWLKKFQSQQVVLKRNAIPNEISLVTTQERKIPQRLNRLAQRRRNPGIARDDFIQFERKKNSNRGPLVTNKVDDFDKQESYTVAPTTTNRHTAKPREQNRVHEVTSPVRHSKINNEIDQREKKRLEETKRLLETGRFENSYTRRRISSTTSSTTTTTTEANVGMGEHERIELERNRYHESRRQQEEEDLQRRNDEEIRRNDELIRREEDRQRMEEKRIKQQREDEERRTEEERLQNQINEETLRLEHEEELKRIRDEQEQQRTAEENRKIHEQHAKEREEKNRQRELELKEREEEEQRLREDEERRQEENRQRLEEVERQQREEEERKRQEAENKRIEEENRRRKKEEFRNKQKLRQNQVEESSEEQVVVDLRLKEKLRRDKIAKMKERIKNLSPEKQLQFYELRGRRLKKQNEGNEDETKTNQI